ncbi:MAG: hypothetical protein WA208_02420 [Thermoanaerobaculia bacterium]
MQRALDSTETDPTAWAYTRTTVEKDGRKVETFDPSKTEGQEWQLVSKDGRTPSQSERAEYRKEKSKGKRKSARGPKGELAAMIRPGTLKLVRESASQAVYEFRLAVDDEDKDDEVAREMIGLMKGRLTVAKDGAWLQIFELENEKPMKPMTGVRIDQMQTKMTYRAPSAGLPPLISEMRVTLRGRAMLVKKLDQDTVATYSDYRRVTAAK